MSVQYGDKLLRVGKNIAMCGIDEEGKEGNLVGGANEPNLIKYI